jgi:hypothetical protein
MLATGLLWGLGGITLALLGAVMAVILARSLEGGGAHQRKAEQTGANHSPAGSRPAQRAASVLSAIKGVSAGKGPHAVEGSTGAKSSSKQTAGTVAAMLAGLAALIGVLAAVLDDDSPPERRAIAEAGVSGDLLSPGRNADLAVILAGPEVGRALAEGLAADDVATLRLDAVADDEAAEQVRRAIPVALRETDRRCIWLVAHSGAAGTVADASSGQREVCGIVLISPVGENLEVRLRAAREKALILVSDRDTQANRELARSLGRIRRANLEVIRGMTPDLRQSEEGAPQEAGPASTMTANIPERLVEEIADFLDDD